MPAPKPPERMTRILLIDEEVFHVVYRREGIIFARRLGGEERALALKMLDDCHAEIEAHLEGSRLG